VPVTQYKKAEKQVADRVGNWLRFLWGSLLAFFRYVMQKGKQRFTVMLIPHSEKKIFNFQISFFTLIFLSSVLIIILVGFFVLTTHFTSTNERMTRVSEELKANEATLAGLKDEISRLRKVSKGFKGQMESILKIINHQDYLASGTGGQLPASAYTAGDENASETLKQLSELQSMTTLIGNSIAPLGEINKALSSFNEWFIDTPTLWPLKGVRGNITTRFGMTVHPFTHQVYLHTGVDIAWGVGTPVEATANGVVEQSGYTEDLGNFVTIKHKYGFQTKYAHLISYTVRKGQKVASGDTIGYLGNTGLSTGPHLHYEVHLGLNYVDPMNFLSIESDLNSVRLVGRNGE
jgi:murein DD-endopeptidase MepM/ murein hydrolase activator NlpD